ncbi:MAG: hypothetical protein ACRYFK_13655 [Janthinobacterium lividum]
MNNLLASLVRGAASCPALGRVLALGGLLLALGPSAWAQAPALPARRSGLERAPLQTTQLDEVRPGDTARVFSLQDLARLVYANHPIVKQAACSAPRPKARCYRPAAASTPS